MNALFKICHFLGYTLPAIGKPLVAHVFGLSPTSTRCKFRVVAIVAIFRAIFNDNAKVSMLEQQMGSIKDPGVYGPLWVVPDEFDIPPDTNLKEKVIEAIGLQAGHESKLNDVELSPVRGEWVGFREGAGKREPQPELAPEEKYRGLLQETKRNMVILFLHGGQFFMRSPASRRNITAELAKLCSCRCFSPQFRLSPQHPFPAAILDCLVAYLSLQYPSPGSLHDSVLASNICLAGDSSGANIALALVQIILELQRQNADGKARLLWQGVEVELELPAAVTMHSAFLDLTRSLPSETNNLPFDLLPHPGPPPFPRSQYISSSIWPANPPRNNVYTSDDMITHPLVSPVLATNWHNCSTRLWFSVGEECLADGSFITAQRAMAQGVVVNVEQYAGMPHDFTLIFLKTSVGQDCLARWAAFMCEAVEQPQSPATSGFVRIDHSGKISEIDPDDVVPNMSLNNIKAGMEAQVRAWNLQQR